MLKKFFPLFCCVVMLSACDHSSSETTQENTAIGHDAPVVQTDQQDATQAQTTDFKRGNYFYIARDVAEMQLRAGDYVQQLKQSQADLEHAIQEKDSKQLQQTATTLQEQLVRFNQTLSSLNLKSQEIEDIRQKLLESNQHVLQSPFLNGQMNWDKMNVEHIEQQMNSIQNEMLKLAALLIPQSDSNPIETKPSPSPETSG